MKTIIAIDINKFAPSKMTIIQTKSDNLGRKLSTIKHIELSSRYLNDLDQEIEDSLEVYYDLVAKGKIELELHFDVAMEFKHIFGVD